MRGTSIPLFQAILSSASDLRPKQFLNGARNCLPRFIKSITSSSAPEEKPSTVDWYRRRQSSFGQILSSSESGCCSALVEPDSRTGPGSRSMFGTTPCRARSERRRVVFQRHHRRLPLLVHQVRAKRPREAYRGCLGRTNPFTRDPHPEPIFLCSRLGGVSMSTIC